MSTVIIREGALERLNRKPCNDLSPAICVGLFLITSTCNLLGCLSISLTLRPHKDPRKSTLIFLTELLKEIEHKVYAK